MRIGPEHIGQISGFILEKDKFYLLSLIAYSEGSILFSDLDSYLMGRSEVGLPIWIWTKDNLNNLQYMNLKNDLNLLMIKDNNKITCKRELYNLLSREYKTSDYFEMGYLSCDDLVKPGKRVGVFAKPNYRDKTVLANYLLDSAREIDHNENMKLDEALEEVDLWIKGQRLYTLLDDSLKIVSMAGYSINGDCAKITHVYTPPDERNKGYCTNLIYELTKKIQDDGYKPILYTNYNYEPANKAYKNVGYKDEGILINFIINSNY